MVKLIKFLRNHKYLIIFAVIAFIFRSIGVTHLAPYIVSTDEPALVRSALGLRFTSIIDHFDWPHFNFYFHYAIYFIYIKVRGVIQVLNLRQTIEPICNLCWNDPYIFYVISRLINSVLGTLTIIPIYLLSKSLFNEKTALIAVIIFAFMPQHIYLSNVATQDIALAFWAMWAMYYIYLILKLATFKNIVLAGIFTGIATGIKYNGIVFLGFYPIYNIVTRNINLFKQKDILFTNIKTFIGVFIVALATFLLTSPYIIIKFDNFWSDEYGKGVIWQFRDNSKPVELFEYLPHLSNLLLNFGSDVGYISTLLLILGPICMIVMSTNLGYQSKRFMSDNKTTNYYNPYIISSYIFVLIYFLYFSINNRAGGRFFIPLYPLISIICAFNYQYFISNLKVKKYLLVLGCILVFVQTYLYISVFYKSDTRILAVNYIDSLDILRKNVFLDSEDMITINNTNNLGMKELKRAKTLKKGDILISENDKIRNNINLIKEIDDKNRLGNKLFIYVYNSNLRIDD